MIDMIDHPIKLCSDDPALADILSLIQRSFSYMQGRIDPPSSMHRLSLSDIANHCEAGEVWSIGQPPKACMFLTWKPDCVYLGKVAVDQGARGQGLSSRLIEVANQRACEKGVDWLELQTRIELTENHKIFAALGFIKCGETAHAGFDRATSITMRKQVLPPQ